MKGKNWPILSSLAYAVVSAEPGLKSNIGPFRAFLLKPKVLVMVSLILQSLEISKVKALRDKDFSIRGSKNGAAHDRNSSQTFKKFPIRTRRSEILYQLANTTQPLIPRNNRTLLVVGPRNIHELFIAWCHGFKWSNISAIDLYSVNNKIKVMDVESMMYDNSTFDTVCMSGVLAYLSNPRNALSEISRVLRPNGVVVIRYPTAESNLDFAPSNTLSPVKLVSWAKELGLALVHYSNSQHINSINSSQITSLLCLRKLAKDELFNDNSIGISLSTE